MTDESARGSVDRRFPVLSRRGDAPKSVPWSLLAPHEKRANTNHGQTLERLAERGGLAPAEIFAIVHDVPWKCAPSPDGAIAWLHATLRATESGSHAEALALLRENHPLTGRQKDRVIEILQAMESGSVALPVAWRFRHGAAWGVTEQPSVVRSWEAAGADITPLYEQPKTTECRSVAPSQIEAWRERACKRASDYREIGEYGSASSEDFWADTFEDWLAVPDAKDTEQESVGQGVDDAG